MTNYYILSINSLVKTFSILDAGAAINFGLTTQDNSKIFESIQIGDVILGYVEAPITEIRYVFTVEGIGTENQIELAKTLEVSNGVEIINSEYVRELAVNDLIAIDKTEYFETLSKMITFTKGIEENILSLGENESERKAIGENILLYGVPGSGKSWTIENEYCENEKLMERLVFHPDYMYSDFVGQILPKVVKASCIL
ncbi:MAG: hypothetical protein R3Y54_11405 [Eubacteriales bacterium]